MGDTKRIREYSIVLCQVLLHRAIFLFEGAISSLLLNNPYSMSLSIRGQFETTGALGYLYSRLSSLNQGRLTPEVVDEDILIQLLGSRDKSLTEAPEAKQVLSLLEYADKIVNKHIMDGSNKKYDVLIDAYRCLCEISHPNFHSNSIAIDIDKEKEQFHIRHIEPMRDREFNLVGYLLISSSIFIELFDMFEDVLSRIPEGS